MVPETGDNLSESAVAFRCDFRLTGDGEFDLRFVERLESSVLGDFGKTGILFDWGERLGWDRFCNGLVIDRGLMFVVIFPRECWFWY